MTDYTPGPWVVGKSYVEDEIAVRLDDAEGQCIAVAIVDAVEHGQAEANARLIAAAPELLILLEEIVEQYKGFPQEVLVEVAPDWLPQALTIIAKIKEE